MCLLTWCRYPDLTKSKAPILLGAPPGPTAASRSHGRRLFYNGTEDRKGPARLPPSSSDVEAQSPKVAPESETEPASSTVAVPDRESAGAATTSDGPQKGPRKQRPITFHPVEVFISTTPKKHPAITPSKVYSVSSLDSDDEFVPFKDHKPTQAARGTKRKARGDSVTLVSSEDERRDVRRVPSQNDKGKGRADDVGMRSPSPPRPDVQPHSADAGPAKVCLLALPRYQPSPYADVYHSVVLEEPSYSTCRCESPNHREHDNCGPCYPARTG